MRKLLVLSVVAFFIVISIVMLGYDYTLGDHPYYVTTGQFGQGHDLTLLILRPMAILGDPTLPIFINFMFALSVYFMLKPFTKYPEWAFLFAPITPLAGVYAQIFAISLFNFALGFYFRGKREIAKNRTNSKLIISSKPISYTVALPPLFLILTFLAHYWTGLFVAGVFALYLFLSDRPDKVNLFSTIIIAGFFFLLMPQTIDFLTQPPTAVPTGYMTTFHFFALLSRGGSFFALSFFGLWKLYAKSHSFFKINLMLFVIPLFIVFVLPTSNYWDWRLIYFMPFLALVSVLMSYLFEGKTE